MKYYVNYIIPLLFLLFVYSCSTEPIETGPYSNSYYCDLNGEEYSNSYYHYLYCNPEGVTLYDSLKKESDFIGRYGRFFECRDTINLPHNFPHKYYTLEYNTYNGFFLSDNAFDFKFSRGRKYASNVSGPFLSSENYFLSPVRCVIEYENDSTKDVVKKHFVDTIPSTFFTPDPIELFEKATTCEEQIANLRYFYELCKNWNEQHM